MAKPSLIVALSEKVHQLRIDAVGVRPQHAMRPAGKFHKLDVLDHLRLPPGRSIRWQNAVVVAVQDERRHIVLWDVLAEVLDPAVDARRGPDGGGASGHVPVVFEHALAYELPARDVVVVEVA